MPDQLLALVLCLTGQADAGVDDLIVAHEETMARIEVIAVESDLYRQRPNLPQQLERRDLWAKDAKRERKRFAFADTRFADGSPMNDVRADLLADDQFVRILWNWDETRQAAAADSSGVRGEILPTGATGSGWFLDASTMLLQRVRPKVNDKGWSAGEYVRAGGNAKVLPGVEQLGYRLVPVAVDHPDTRTSGRPPASGVKSTLYFAPDLGGIVLKQVHEYPAGSGATEPLRVEVTAVKLEQVDGGIMLPTRVKFVTMAVGPPPRVIDQAMIVSQVAINEHVPESAFDFRFPPGTIVTQQTANGPIEHVWGEDNQPAETRSPRPPLYAYPIFFFYYMGIDGSAINIIALGLVGLILVYGIARFLRSRQCRKQQASTAS